MKDNLIFWDKLKELQMEEKKLIIVYVQENRLEWLVNLSSSTVLPI